MNLGISSLAWPPGDDRRIAGALQALDMHHIDVVPGKLGLAAGWPSPFAVQEVRRGWSDFGISILGVQSIFFDNPSLNLFGTTAMREAMLEHLRRVGELSAGLGATRLVFGSARNRRRGDRSPEEAETLALEFFRSAAEIAVDHGTILCIEAAPIGFGGDFACTTTAAATLVATLDHPGVRLQLDLGILTFEPEPIDAAVARFAPLVGHVHLSEPGLRQLGLGGADHRTFAEALRRHLPGLPGTIEMLVAEDDDAVAAVRGALTFASIRYATE